MKIQLISDIHFEFLDSPDFYNILIPSAPYLAILGDINYIFGEYKSQYKSFLSYCSDNFKTVFLVPGNHEYYQCSNIDKLDMDQADNELETLTVEFNNIYFMQRKNIIIKEDNIKYVILGSTLWTNILSTENDDILNTMRDYKYIYNEKGLIYPADIINLHKKNTLWLLENVTQAKGIVIVLSHHMPSYDLIVDEYKNSKFNSSYASSLEYLMLPQVKLWLFGHTHFSLDMTIRNCRCISNPYGYHGENDAFKKDMV